MFLQNFNPKFGFWEFLLFINFNKTTAMKNKEKISRPFQALLGSICIILSRVAANYGLDILDVGLLFIGSFIFGWIFESIKIERKASQDEM